MALDPSGGVAWQCLEERDGSNNLVARYTYAPGYIDAVAVQERDLNSDQDFGDSNEKVYYHANTLYSVYALTDGSENVIERYAYDAYGGATVLDADFSSDADGVSDVENPYLFTGRRLDSESMLMYYRNRQYDTALGRFISRDPEGYDDWLSLYLYVAGNPVSSFDPMGLLVVPVGKEITVPYLPPWAIGTRWTEFRQGAWWMSDSRYDHFEEVDMGMCSRSPWPGVIQERCYRILVITCMWKKDLVTQEHWAFRVRIKTNDGPIWLTLLHLTTKPTGRTFNETTRWHDTPGPDDDIFVFAKMIDPDWINQVTPEHEALCPHPDDQ